MKKLLHFLNESFRALLHGSSAFATRKPNHAYAPVRVKAHVLFIKNSAKHNC